MTRGRGQHAHGQALVEFAIVAPIVFLIILGLFDVGRLVFINNELSEGAREGARFGVVQGRAAAEFSGDSTAVSDARSCPVRGRASPQISLSCGARRHSENVAGDCGSGDLLTISVSSDVRPITPLIGDIIGPLVLTSQAQMTVH